MTSTQLQHIPTGSPAVVTGARQDPLNYGTTMATNNTDILTDLQCEVNQTSTITCDPTLDISVYPENRNTLDPAFLHSVRFATSGHPWYAPSLIHWSYSNFRQPHPSGLTDPDTPANFSGQLHYRDDPVHEKSRPNVSGMRSPSSTLNMQMQRGMQQIRSDIPRTNEDSDSPSDFSLPTRSEADNVEPNSEITQQSTITNYLKDDNRSTPYLNNLFCAKTLFYDPQSMRNNRPEASVCSWDYSRWVGNKSWSHDRTEYDSNRIMLDLDNFNKRPATPNQPNSTPIPDTTENQFAAAAAACVAAAAVAVAAVANDSPGTPSGVQSRLSPTLCPNPTNSLNPLNRSYESSRLNGAVYPLPSYLYRPPYPSYSQLKQFNQGRFPHHGPHTFAYGLDGARRKNATRESTTTLKVWLQEHIKNPYPTKGEKIMLAIITKMTLTQVSTWFANARRRLKKENKMCWSIKSGANSHTSTQHSPDGDHPKHEPDGKKASYEETVAEDTEDHEDTEDDELGADEDESSSTSDEEQAVNKQTMNEHFNSGLKKCVHVESRPVFYDDTNGITDNIGPDLSHVCSNPTASILIDRPGQQCNLTHSLLDHPVPHYSENAPLERITHFTRTFSKSAEHYYNATGNFSPNAFLHHSPQSRFPLYTDPKTKAGKVGSYDTSNFITAHARLRKEEPVFTANLYNFAHPHNVTDSKLLPEIECARNIQTHIPHGSSSVEHIAYIPPSLYEYDPECKLVH